MEQAVEYVAEKKSSPIVVVLGRNGDILSTLPMLYDEFLKTGDRQRFMVAKEYAGVLDGCSYIEPVIFEGEFTDIPGAVEYAKTLTQEVKVSTVTGYRPFLISQVYKNNVKIAQESYQKEMWALAGKLPLWKTNPPLVLDRRSPERESSLVHGLKDQLKKPRTILVSLSGISSPFQYKELLLELVTLKFNRSYNIIDISNLQAERIYDLLGLFDTSDVLISSDSALLHLACASKIPVVALVADTPSMWHGSQIRENHIAHIRYSQFPKYALSILDSILNVGTTGSQWNKKLITKQRLIHIWSHYDMSGAAKRRHQLARQTWLKEYDTNQWIESFVPEGAFYRTSKSQLKDDRALPFIKDVIKFGAVKAKENDILVLTNSDTCLREGVTNEIIDLVNKHGAIHGHRRDFTILKKVLPLDEIKKGSHYMGSDLFAFTREWWFERMHEFPDMVQGAEGGDRILRQMIQKYAGVEIKNACYHERHSSVWEQRGYREDNVSNRHSRRVGSAWLKANNLPLLEFAQFKD